MLAIINGRQREITNLQAVSHTRRSVIDGEEVDEVDYAEYIVIGSNSEWIDWTPLDEFREANPGVI